MTPWKNLVVALVAAFALAACSSSNKTATVDMPDPGPSAYQMALDAIAAATTDAAAQAAVDAAAGDVTGAELRELQAAADARMVELATMDRAEAQKMALTTAAGMIDTSDLSTQEAVDAAGDAITALKAALAAAADVSDADKAMYQGRVTAAEAAVMTAQSTLDHAAQTMALTGAVEALEAIDLGDLSSEEAIEAAGAAIASVQMALDMATELSATEKAVATALVANANRTVMAAQGRMDVAAQEMGLEGAVDALEMLDLDNLMTQEAIDAANAAIIALDLALAAASDLTDAQKLDALTDVTLAKRKVTAAETVLAENVGDQRMALTEAGTALAEIDLDDLDTPEKITAANNAVMALKAALDGATHLSEAQKAMYQSQLDTATETVRMAQTGMDRDGRMMAQRTAITDAVTAARTAVAGVKDTSTDSEVASADAAVKAVKDAIEAAEDLSEDAAEIIGAMAVLETIEPQLAAAKTSRTAAMAKADEEQGKADAALGKAMHDALAGPATTSTALDNIVTTDPANFGLQDDGTFRIDAAANAGVFEAVDGTDTDPSPVTLKAGDSAGALGSWSGMDYAHTDTGTKVMNEARVYTNQGPGERVTFTKAGYDVATETDADNDVLKGYVLLATDGTFGDATPISKVMADAFTHSGNQNHAFDPDSVVAFTARGTYDGAPGVYRCAEDCSSLNDGKGSPTSLGGTWHFKPDAGANAMALQPDANYLYYGWWVSKDKDGMPTAASAFTGMVGTIAGIDSAATPSTLATSGSATYVGHAAGKFALSNPLDATGSAGHFTADATLTATFSGTGAGVTGELDNFMANDESVPWSVSLNNRTLAADTVGAAAASNLSTTGAITSAGSFDTATPDVDESKTTVWSINGNAAPASGTWSGQMYDEMPGNTDSDPAGDGSNIPTTVTGTFYSEFSTIGRMVGAFGADKQ